MSPLNPIKDHIAIEIDLPEKKLPSRTKERIAFVGLKALQTAGAVYKLGTEWAKSLVPSAALESLKPWLYYGKGVETDIEKRWATLQKEDEKAAAAALNEEVTSLTSTGAWLGASSLMGSASRWFWGPTYLVIPDFKDDSCNKKVTLLLNKTSKEHEFQQPVCTHLLDESKERLLSRCQFLKEDKSYFTECSRGIFLEELPHNSWSQNAIDFFSKFSGIKTLQEVSKVGVNIVASSIAHVVGNRETPREVSESEAWKTKLAEVSMGLGEAGMVSYLIYSGDFTAMGVLTPLFILPSVFMNLVAKDEMEEGGNKRLAELKEELTPLAAKIASEALTPKEQAVLMAPFKEQIEELQALQKKESQAEGLFPKQREWKELHHEKTNKVGVAVYQTLRSIAGCFIPFVGIQSAFSTAHLLSSRAITAVTGDQQLGRWALPAATAALTVLSQAYMWKGLS